MQAGRDFDKLCKFYRYYYIIILQILVIYSHMVKLDNRIGYRTNKVMLDAFSDLIVAHKS